MNARTQKRPPRKFDSREWDFSAVPPEEIPFCLLWEMARESAAVENVVRRWATYLRESEAWAAAGNTEPFDASGEKQRAIYLAASALQPKINFPFRRGSFEHLIAIFGRHGARARGENKIPPWQKLKPETKEKLVAEFCGDPAWLGYPGSGAVKTGNGFDFAALQTGEKEGRWYRRPGFEFANASCFDPEGREVLVLVIDWPRFDDTAIKQGLDKWWAEKQKPERENPPVKREQRDWHKTMPSRMLANLGYARVRARYTAQQAARECPEAWEGLTGSRDYTAARGGEFNEKVRDRARTFYDYFREAFDFDKKPSMSQREFEARRTR